MTPQEQQMIDGLIDRVRNTKLANKDADADKHLRDGLGSNPDALYILAQTVLGQTYSLSEAARQVQALRAENEQLRSQANKPSAPAPAPVSNQSSQPANSGWQGQSSNAGNQGWSAAPSAPSGQGYNNSVPYQPVNNPQPAYGQPYPQPPYGQGYPQPQYGQAYPQPYPQQGFPSVYGQPQYGYPAPAMGGGSFGGGGFLQGAMTAAAGVAAGELLFHGVEDIARGFERPRDYGGSYERFGDGPRETVVNNYYEDGERHGGGSSLGDVSYDSRHDASRDTAGSADIGSAAGSAFGNDPETGGSDFGSSAGNAFGASRQSSGDWNGGAEQLLNPNDNFDPNQTSAGSGDGGWGGSSESLLSPNDSGGFDAGQTYDSGDDISSDDWSSSNDSSSSDDNS